MDDIRFTFGGDPTDAARASEKVETKLEQLQRQALKTSAALKTIGAPRSGAMAQLGATAGREQRNVDLLDSRLGKVVGTMTKVNVQFRFFQNLMGLIRWPAIVAGVGLLTQGLSALAAGAVAVTGAIAPMGGAIAALPAVISGAVQAIATFKLALGGLDDALKAQKEGVNVVRESQMKLQEAWKSHREVARTAGRGSLEFRDSLLEVQKAQKAVREAQEQSNPALERFAALIDQKVEPAMARLRRSAARGLLPGLGRGMMAALGGLGGRLENIVGRTGGVLGQGAENLGGLLGGRGGDISRIGGSNIRVITQLSSALTSLTGALVDVMVAGGPFVVWLARGANNLAQWIERATSAGRKSGDLARFLDSAKTSLTEMWNVLRPFGAALINIFQAASPLGHQIMQDLGGAAESFKSWTESVEGQNKLHDYFEDVKVPLYEVARLVRDLVATFFRLGDDPGFANFVNRIRVDLLPTLERLVSQTTAQFGPALTDALVAVADLIAALAGSSGPLTLFVEAIAGIANFFTMIVESAPIVRDTLFTLVGVAATMAAVKFTGMITGLSAVLGLMRGISGASARGAGAQGFFPTLGAIAGPGARTAVPGGAAAPVPVPAGGIINPRTGQPFPGVAGVPVTPPSGIRGRIGAAGPPAAAIGGFLAAGAGASMGGVGGNILMGAGIGAAVGAPFGGIGVPGALIGAGAGAIGGGLLAAMQGLGKSSGEVDKLTASLNLLGQTFRNQATAMNNLSTANEAARDSRLNLTAANIQVERAEKNLAETRKQFGKNSLEAREAEVALKIARENQSDAAKEERRAELEAAEAREKDRKARTEQIQQMHRTADTVRDEIQAIKDRRLEGRHNAEQMADFEAQKQKDVNAAVDRYQQKMRTAAAIMRQQSRPELAKVAEAAERLASRLNRIPTDVEINAEIRFFAKFEKIDIVESHRSEMSAQGSGRGTPRSGPGPSTGDGPSGPLDHWMNDQTNAAIMGGAKRFVRENREAILSKVRPSFSTAGGIVGVGRWLQGLGYLVGEHPAFGGVAPVHVPGSMHYSGRALDVNYVPRESEPPMLDKVYPLLRAMNPTELLWRTTGHYDHLHVAFRQGGRVPGKGSGDTVPAMLSPGEAVLTGHGQSLVDAIGGSGTMEQILQSQRPHFRKGGSVQGASAYADRVRGLLERMELRQELSGTGTTASEMAAQARFIRRRLIPAERAELRALERARRRALQNGNKELARELKSQIFEQQTEILRLQLDAQQRTRAAAEETAQAMKEFGGGIGFQFGSSLFTDRLLGSMVGA